MKQIFSILFLFVTCSASATRIEVGYNKLFTSIRKAIEAASTGDTVLVYGGVYREGNILLQKSISLIGLDEPVLDGESRYEILTISGTDILVKGFLFRNSGYSSLNDYAAIGVIDARFIMVENNRVEHSYFAIHFANSTHCIIQNNIIKGTPRSEQTSGNGIHLWKCDDILVEGNNVQGHRDGIYFEFVTNSSIENNYSHNNIRYGLHFMFSNDDAYLQNNFFENGSGVAVMYSHRVLMLKNTFEHNWGPSAYGILLKEISDAQILDNHFIRNTAAIVMESTNRLELALNDFKSNGWALRIQASCDESTIHHNDFSGNTFDVATNGTMMLNKFYRNYWDRYEGYDLNRDGRGDVPYHPVSMYSMVVEQNPNSLILLRSFMVSLLDKAEKAIPSLTPENLVDVEPLMKKINHDPN
ncbi:MAG: nitrous oxide reductase family maturation protein NosD [Flavisolibacter sp.]